MDTLVAMAHKKIEPTLVCQCEFRVAKRPQLWEEWWAPNPPNPYSCKGPCGVIGTRRRNINVFVSNIHATAELPCCVRSNPHLKLMLKLPLL